MANTSLSTLRSWTRAEFKLDRLGKVWSDPEVNDSINEAILEIQNKWDYKWDENQTSTTFNTVVDTQDYAISTVASDLIAVDLIKYNTTTLSSTDYITLSALYSEFPSWDPQNYYLYGWNIGFSPIPTEINTVTLIYRWILANLTTDTDLSPFPTNFDKAIRLYASYVLLSKPGDTKNEQRAQLKLSNFEKEIEKLIKTYLTQDRGQFQYKTTYTPRISSYKRSRFANI